MSSPRPDAIGIVVYHPDPEILVSLLTVAASGSDLVYIFLNAPLAEDTITRLHAAAGPRLSFLESPENLGLGVAFNRMVAASRAADARTLLLFDQDSSPPPGMHAHLLATWTALRAAGERPAVIGPLAVSADQEQFKPPRRFPNAAIQNLGTAWPAEFLISSGSLLDLDVFDAIGPFREDFFIDAIDIEWCFRAWARGYSCWIDSAAPMPHRLGQGTIRVKLLNMHLARQPPARLYTYVRNQIAMLRAPETPSRWKLRIVPYLCVQGLIYVIAGSGSRLSIARAFGQGLIDGLTGRMGAGRRSDF